MASENETVSEIVKEMRDEWAQCYFSEGAKRKDGEYSEFPAIDTNEVAGRIEAAHKRKVAKLRECLKEAVREKCPFTRMSCKHGEQCNYECGTENWRKALERSNYEKE